CALPICCAVARWRAGRAPRGDAADRTERYRVPLLGGAAILARFGEAEQAGALERGDVMIEPRRRLPQQVGDLFRRARRFGEHLDQAESQRVGQRPHLGEAGLERRGAACPAGLSVSWHVEAYIQRWVLTRDN